MSRLTRPLTLVLGAALLVAPALAAQPGRAAGDRQPQGAGPRGGMRDGMRDGMRGPGGVTALLNARRELELTPRQVAQLDSLERVQFAEHKALQERILPVRDSIAARARTGNRTPAFRDSIQTQARARMESTRPLMDEQRKRDSSRHAAAERVLNDTQRQKVREIQAERRGFERGLRESRGQDRGPGRAQRGGPPQAGARGQMRRGLPGGMQGGMPGGLRGGRGMRGPQGPGASGGRAGMPPRPPVEQESNDR